MTIATKEHIFFSFIVALASSLALPHGARAQAPSCFSGPTKQEGYWQTYTAKNDCGYPVKVYFTETDSTEVRKTFSVINACSEGQLVQTFTNVRVDFTAFEFNDNTERKVCTGNSQGTDSRQTGTEQRSPPSRPKAGTNDSSNLAEPSAPPKRAKWCGDFNPSDGPVPQKCAEVNSACVTECQPANYKQRVDACGAIWNRLRRTDENAASAQASECAGQIYREIEACTPGCRRRHGYFVSE
jgi:hypothetical protein